jgi:hypothetical protein
MSDKLLDILNQDANAEYKVQYAKAQNLQKKWSRTGLLDELNGDYEKSSMATLLENQAKELIKEISKSGGSGAEEWSGVALPLVRRIFAEISAKDFVSVQPMNLPSGLAFFLDFKYGTSQPGFSTTAGASNQGNSLYGVTNQPGEPTGGLYGAGRFGYSINPYSTTTATYTSASATWNEVNFDPILSASCAAGQIFSVHATMTGAPNYDTNGVRSFYISGSSNFIYYPAYTKPTDSTDALSTTVVTFYVSQSATAQVVPTLIKYSKQPTASTRGDFEATGDPAYTDLSAANALAIPEVQVDLRQEPIAAKSRKLKAVWTPEFAQDLNAYHAIDAENELTGILSEYISMEIDLEILDMLIQNANITDYWSAKVGNVYIQANDPWFGSQDAQQGASLAYTQNTWFQTLGTKIQKVSNQIHKKTMRGGANFITCSPNVATILESIPGYAALTDGNKMQFAMGTEKTANLSNRWNVYKNPYMTDDVLLMGFKGSQFLEAGAVFAPYIPLIMTPMIYDPINLTPRKGIMTRYAKKILRPEFYGRVVIADLNYV